MNFLTFLILLFFLIFLSNLSKATKSVFLYNLTILFGSSVLILFIYSFAIGFTNDINYLIGKNSNRLKKPNITTNINNGYVEQQIGVQNNYYNEKNDKENNK